MKGNSVPFGMPKPGTGIVQLITELDVSNTKMFLIEEIPEQQYQNRLESKAMRKFVLLQIACHNAHILKKYITKISFKMQYVGIFVKHTLCSLYRNHKKFCKPKRREDNS